MPENAKPQPSYKGPLYYTEEDEAIFRGREKETEELFYVVKHNDFSVCYAESGEGKSSLINAGLTPRLRKEGFLPIRIVFDDGILNEEINEGSPKFDDYIWEKVEKAVKFPVEDKGMVSKKVWWKLRPEEITINSSEVAIPVLIFDQFEEVFTCAKDQNWTYAFFRWLEELYQDESPDGKSYLPKKFKVLLSLRSEYVSELDYWSMSQCFIPSLKNNRYCLKPLRKGSAKEVAKELENLPSGLELEDIVKYAKTDRSGNWESIKEDGLPCVSALILSLILTALSKDDEKVNRKLKDIGHLDDAEHRNEFLEFLLDQTYEKALQECEKNSDDNLKPLLEELEEMLIDDYGKRRRIHECQLPAIPREKLEILKKSRVINEIDNHYEISHDKLVPIINMRREKRKRDREERKLKDLEEKAERARIEALEVKRRETLREDLTSSLFLLIAFVFIVWLLHTFFQDKTSHVNILDRSIMLKSVPIFANLIIVPFLIHATVKRFKISQWLSTYGLIANIVFLIIFFWQGDLSIKHMMLAIFTLGLPAITLLYSLKTRSTGNKYRNELKKMLQAIPLWVFFLVLSSYVFYLTVCNTTIGIPNPRDSFWGIFIIPLLTHKVMNLVFRQKVRKASFIALCLLLCVLAFNNGWRWFFKTSTCCFAFSMVVILFFFLCIVLVVCSLYRGLHGWKRIIALVVELLVIAITFLGSLGFCPWKVNRDMMVNEVHNWLSAIVQDKNGQYGLVSCCGESLLPCVFDSCSHNVSDTVFLSLRTNKLKWENDAVSLTELAGQPIWDYKKETGVTTYNYLFHPLLEKEILMKAKDSTLVLEHYAAKVCQELRRANLSAFQSGQMYSLDSIGSLPMLYDLQRSEFNKVKKQVLACKDEVYDMLKAEHVTAFYKAFTRLFCLCMMRDQINKGNISNLMDLYHVFIPLYFIENNYRIGFSSEFIIVDKKQKFNLDYLHFNIRVTDLRSDDINSWFNYLMMTTRYDIGFNVQEVKNQLSNYKNRADSIHNEIGKKGKDKKFGKLIELINVIKQVQSLKYENNRLSKDILKTFYARKEIEKSYKELVIETDSCLSPFLKTRNIYNSSFEYIYMQLYIIAMFRGYDWNKECLEKVRNVVNEKQKEFNRLEEPFQEIYDELKELKDLNEKMRN